MNIRDTNWLRFSSDKRNCWNVDKYQASCIGVGADQIGSGSYTLHTRNGVWYLSGAANIVYTNWANYKNQYQVGLSTEGFYTQTGITATPCSAWLQKDCTTIFTREINITYVNTGTMLVKSTARWLEKRHQSVTLETTLTNWKSNF
jgi:hypothetical protein